MAEIFLGMSKDCTESEIKEAIKHEIKKRGEDRFNSVFIGFLEAEVEEPEIHELPYQGKAQLRLQPEINPGVKLIPAETLKKIDADFCLAKLKCSVYIAGRFYFWIIQYIGPSDEELLQDITSRISDEDVEELDRLAKSE